MMLDRTKEKCLVFIIILILSGCATVKNDFEQASRIDSIPAYEKFLKKHPNTEFEQAAQARVRELEEQEEKEKKRQAKLEQGAWENAKEQNSISSYAEFLNSYSDSNYSFDAKNSIKTLIRETALTSLGGDKGKIRSGDEFPLNLFSVEDIIKGFGSISVGYVVQSQASQGLGMNLGSKEFRSYSGWHNFYSNLVNSVSNSSSTEMAISIGMVPFTTTAISSLNPGSTVTFYNNPENSKSTALGLSIVKKLKYGKIENEKIAIDGAGVAILKKEGSFEVYEFTKEGVSIFQ